MINYKITIEDKTINIEIVEEKGKCKFCGEDTVINGTYKSKLYIKNLFYKNFEKEVILKHNRVRCKSCNKSYMLTSILQVKKYLKETRKELEQKVFKIMFENNLLDYMELTER